MFGFLINFLFLLAESSGSAAEKGGWLGWWYENVDPYMNYPGFELWRFINLAIFFSIIAYLIKKPLSESFKAKREVIRAELIKAEAEKKAAVARLAESEAKIAGLESEKAEVIRHAKAEAEAEKERLKAELESEIKRLRSQADGEIHRKLQQEQARLKRFTAEESIRLAEEKIRQAMSAETDAKLVRANIESIGGMR
jgi:F0F1-type ATP synthase membrane subunit b/b'